MTEAELTEEEEARETARERCAHRPFSTGITPEATAHFIEAIASDKAARLKTLAKATVVLMQTPEWVRAEEANALFGIPHNQLVTLAMAGKVKARKLDPMLKASAVVFEVASIRTALESLTPYDEWVRERPDKEKDENGTDGTNND